MAWARSKLTGLADFINGFAFKPTDWGDEGLPIIRIEQLRNPSKIEDFYSGHLPDHNIINNGDLVFSWSASLFLRIWENGSAALNQHLFKVIEREGVSRTFLKYLIEYQLPNLAKAAHGSTMQHITRKELNAIEVDYPADIQEQERIADILWSVDSAIDDLEAVVAKQQRIKAGLMQDLLTTGLDENGNIRSDYTHEFKDSFAGRIPTEWSVEKLSSLTTVIVDGVHHTPSYVDFGVPFVTVKNLTKSDGIDFTDLNYISQSDHEIFKKRVFPRPNDVLVTKDGTLGVARAVRSSTPEFSIFVSVALLRPIVCKVEPEYVALFFETPEFSRQLARLSAGTGLRHIHLEHFREFLLRVPKLEEQRRILSYLNEVISSSKAASNTLYKLRAVKAGLMHDLLSGKVSTPEAHEEARQVAGAAG